MTPDVRYPRLSRSSFITQIAQAICHRKGFAAGKIGGSEKHLLYRPIMRERFDKSRQRRAAQVALGFYGETQCGIFPSDAAFHDRFLAFYVERLRQLDALGLFGWPNEPEILDYYRFDVPVMDFLDQEPDRSFPDEPDACYLRHFKGKRILLVSPFAELIAARANRSTFEAVWARTGKRWFEPAQVEALTMLYGTSPETQARYSDSIGLFEHVAATMATRRFDVALIAAGGLGIPLAVEAKSRGAVAIALGGHLQVLFGLKGKRWREREDWQPYFTPAWIDVPDDYRPRERVLTDDGAYW